MGSRRTPTRADHAEFCRREGWEQVRSARGKRGGHHITYELSLPDGRRLRTRISHPPGRIDYGPGLWSHILRDQLQVSESEFWDCVENGIKPARSATREAGTGVPAQVIYHLVTTFQIPESVVAAMTRQEAIAHLDELWSQRR